MESLILVFIYICIISSVLPFIKTHIRWIRFFDYPRAQVVVLSAFIIGVSFIQLDLFNNTFHLVSLIVLCVTFFYQLRMIIPYTVLSKKEVLKAGSNKETISILISNVKMSNDNYDKYVQIIKSTNPDIVLSNEVDSKWVDAISEIEKDYKYCLKEPIDNTYGMAFYSKIPFKNGKVNFLISDDIPSVKVTMTLKDGEEFDFYGVHPKPPTLHSDTEERDAELILVGKTVKKNNRPAIVAGDLNDVAWSRTTNLFKKISGLLDPRVGRGFFNTYNAFIPIFRYPLDYIFISRSFRLIGMKRMQKFGSDHFPMLITLSYEPEKKHAQKKHVADSEDKKEAEEILEKVNK